MKFIKVLFENLINYIGLLFIFILYSWDKFYIINIKKRGNDTTSYFYYTKTLKCCIHNSYKCGCVLDETNKNLEEATKNLLYYYDICSTIITFNKKKINYIDVSTKMIYVGKSFTNGKNMEII